MIIMKLDLDQQVYVNMIMHKYSNIDTIHTNITKIEAYSPIANDIDVTCSIIAVVYS